MSVDPTKQVFSPNSRVIITNEITGKDQAVSGSNANSMITNNRASVSTSKNSAMKSYVPLDVSKEPQKRKTWTQENWGGLKEGRIINEILSFKKQNQSQDATTLKTGSEVIDIKTGKRHRVIVKQLDVAKRRVGKASYFGGMGISPRNVSIQQPYKYVVGGKSYSLEEFKQKFGIPIFSEMKTDTTTNTGFSVQRLTPSSVTPIQ